jgi:hypothetical protein
LEIFVAIDDDMHLVEHLLDDIDEITRSAHTRYRSYSPDVLVEHSPRAAATCTYDHMVALADRLWADRAGITMKEIRGLKVWLIGSAAVLRFKKMDEDGRTRNYPTKQAKNFDRQLPLPGLPAPAIRLTAGYVLDETQTQFIRSQIAKPMAPGLIDWCAAIVPPSQPDMRATWQDVSRQAHF